MGVTPGKKTLKRHPKAKSPAAAEIERVTPDETSVTDSSKAVTSISNNLVKTPDSKQKMNKGPKSLKRKLDNNDYKDEMEPEKSAEAKDSENDLSVHETEAVSSSKMKRRQKRQKLSETETSGNNASEGKNGDDVKEENIPVECHLFVSGLGLEGMTQESVVEFFKTKGHRIIQITKKKNSRHAYLGFQSSKKAAKAKHALDKTDCSGFPLSVENKCEILSGLSIHERQVGKETRTQKTEFTSDCILYLSPLTSEVTRPKVLAAFPGVLDAVQPKSRKGKKGFYRLQCSSADVAKDLYRTHQDTVIESCTLKLETVEEFQKRREEENNKLAAYVNSEMKSKSCAEESAQCNKLGADVKSKKKSKSQKDKKKKQNVKKSKKPEEDSSSESSDD